MLALLLAGCATGANAHGPGTAGPAARTRPVATSAPRPPSGLTARVVLPSATMTAGSTMAGHVLIDNNTGRPIRASGCLGLFAVLLTSPTYRPGAAWPDCLQRFTIPVGRARYRVALLATYTQCSQGRPQAGQRACLPDGHMPPLPPGTYRAKLFQSTKLVRVPPSVSIRVTPP